MGRGWFTLTQRSGELEGYALYTSATSSIDGVLVKVVAVPELDFLAVIRSPDADLVESLANSADVLPDGYAAMPDIRGASREEGERKLRDAGLVPQVELIENSNRVSGNVFETDPRAGTILPEGHSVMVKVAVSPGPEASP